MLPVDKAPDSIDNPEAPELSSVASSAKAFEVTVPADVDIT